MMKYEVTLYYRYKDVQVIEADSREEALAVAESNANETYDCYLDHETREIGE